MTKLATRSNKLSKVLQYELLPEYGHCRSVDTVVVEAGMDIGAVVARTLISPTGTAVKTGTGNGAMGTITVTKYAQVGVYTLRVVKAATDAGDFVVLDPAGVQIGAGTVGVAFTSKDMSFTLADGSTDFIVGDTFAITVAGTVKYEWVEAADVAALAPDVRIVIDVATPVTTAGDASLVTLGMPAKGYAGVAKQALQFKDALSAGQLATVVAALAAKGIKSLTQV